MSWWVEFHFSNSKFEFLANFWKFQVERTFWNVVHHFGCSLLLDRKKFTIVFSVPSYPQGRFSSKSNRDCDFDFTSNCSYDKWFHKTRNLSRSLHCFTWPIIVCTASCICVLVLFYILYIVLFVNNCYFHSWQSIMKWSQIQWRWRLSTENSAQIP